MWENLNIALKSLNGIILLIIYLRSTTGLTDTIINELSGSFIESGIPIEPKNGLFYVYNRKSRECSKLRIVLINAAT